MLLYVIIHLNKLYMVHNHQNILTNIFNNFKMLYYKYINHFHPLQVFYLKIMDKIHYLN